VPTEDELLRLHKPLVLHCARLHRGRGVEHADLVQEGLLGAVIAIRSHDPMKPAKLSTWIALHAQNRMRAAVRIRQRQQRTTLLEDADRFPDSSRDPVLDLELYDALSVVSQRMTALQVRVFFAWLGIGIPKPLPISEIVRRCGVARQKVMQIVAYGLQLCRDLLGVDCDLRTVRIARANHSIAG
jgi:RNA polymerase sigma factor (sigma-70 family)